MSFVDKVNEALAVLKSYSWRDWLHLGINELIHLSVVFLFVMAIQIHIDSKEYGYQCDQALQKYRMALNPVSVQLNNVTNGKAFFGFKNTSILQLGKSCIIDVPC